MLPKVAYIAFCDVKGGAARGAHRLVTGFKKAGIDCDFWVRRKFDESSFAKQYQVSLSTNKQKFNQWLASEVYPKLREQRSDYQSFNLRYTGLDDFINSNNYDVVILHWIGGDTISIKELARIRVPVIWRLADQWAVSGSAHYVDPQFSIDWQNTELLKDANNFVLKRKLRFWKNCYFHFVAGSRWLSDDVNSNQHNNFGECRVIPSSLDTDVFKPLSGGMAASYFPQLEGKRYILFGSGESTKDMRKGFDLLCTALGELALKTNNSKLVLAVFGNSTTPDLGLPIEVVYLGNINDDQSLVALYSDAHVTVVPSRVDNLPFVAMESLA